MRKIYPALTEIFSEILGLPADSLTPETAVLPKSFQEQAAAVLACEKAFRVRIEDERVAALKTMAQWTAYIQERILDSREDRPAPTEQERESWYCR